MPFEVRCKGGKGKLGLFTHVPYELSVKSIPNGIVTFESGAGGDGHFVQLALNDVESASDHTSWVILPENEQSAEYKILLLSHPEWNLTYTHGTSWGGRYLELDSKYPQNYLPGGTMYSSTLWTFESSEIPNYFTVHNADPRRNPNFLTFSNEPSESGQRMQIATKDIHMYSAKGSFHQDCLWSFTPQRYELHCIVTNFKASEESLTAEDLAEFIYPLKISEEDRGNFEPSFKIPETYKLTFLQSFRPFSSVTVDGDNLFSAITFLKAGNKSLETMEFHQKSFTQFKLESDATFDTSKEFQSSEKSRKDFEKIQKFCNVIRDVELELTAEVKVSVSMDIFDNGQICTVNQTSPEILDYFLLNIGKFKGKKKGVKGKKPNKELEEIFEVTARLCCTCGLNAFLEYE